MSSDALIDEYPCPLCGKSRGGLDTDCEACGWSLAANLPSSAMPESRVSKPAAVAIGLLTFVPFAYGAAVNVSIFLAFATGRYPSFDSTAVIMLGQALVVLLILVLLGFYLWFLFETDRIPPDKKPLWAVVLFLGNVVSMPVFWYLHLWKPACQCD